MYRIRFYDNLSDSYARFNVALPEKGKPIEKKTVPYSQNRKYFGRQKHERTVSAQNPAIYLSQETSKGEHHRPVSAVTRRLPKPRPLSG